MYWFDTLLKNAVANPLLPPQKLVPQLKLALALAVSKLPKWWRSSKKTYNRL